MNLQRLFITAAEVNVFYHNFFNVYIYGMYVCVYLCIDVYLQFSYMNIFIIYLLVIKFTFESYTYVSLHY